MIINTEPGLWTAEEGATLTLWSTGASHTISISYSSPQEEAVRLFIIPLCSPYGALSEINLHGAPLDSNMKNESGSSIPTLTHIPNKGTSPSRRSTEALRPVRREPCGSQDAPGFDAQSKHASDDQEAIEGRNTS